MRCLSDKIQRMTSQFKVQNPSVAYTTPLPTTGARLAEEKLLDIHQIEPELRGMTPRLVCRIARPRPAEVWVYSLCFVPVLILYLFKIYQFFIRYPSSRTSLAVVIATVILFGWVLLRWVLAQINKMPNLLRYGDAVSAVITGICEGANNTVVYVRYRALAGHSIGASLPRSPQTITEMGLSTNSTMTLLVSPKDDQDVLPHFQTRAGFEVLPDQKTAVSHAVSARLQAQTVPSLGISNRIEPELRLATPRPVRVSREYFHPMMGSGVAIATYATAIALIWNKIVSDWSVAVICAIVGNLLYVYLEAYWRSVRVSYDVLRHHLPASAKIHSVIPMGEATTHSLKDQKLQFLYGYRTPTGAVYERQFICSRQQACQLGLTEGATFTVLYDPDRPDKSTPYFSIRNAEIVGALGAKVTPP